MFVSQYNWSSESKFNYVEINLVGDSGAEIYEKIFDSLKKNGIICNAAYSDSKWELTDRFDTQKIDFSLIKETPGKLSIEKYEKILKNNVLIKLRNGNHFAGVCKCIKKTIEIGNASNGFREEIEKPVPIDVSGFMEEFLGELEIEYEYEVEEKRDYNRRILLADEEYYLFEDRINEFWNTATEDEKKKYFPLYLFWKLCNIIPTRPKEFCIIPWNCVYEEKGEYFMRLPKSNIKGGQRKVPNNVDLYPQILVQIPEYMGKEILWFQEKTIGKKEYSQNRLFNKKLLNELFSIKSDKKIFTNTDLLYLRDQFYNLYSVRHPEFDIEQIEKWRLGDLRHVALINMITQGVDPTVCMYFAGHSDISTVLHYGLNMQSFSKLRIYDFDRFSVRKWENEEDDKQKAEPVEARKIRPLLNGTCKNNYGKDDKWNCENYPDCNGCIHFVPKDGVVEIESLRVKLWEHFWILFKKNDYEAAKKVLIEFQRQTAIYEEMLNGQKKEVF